MNKLSGIIALVLASYLPSSWATWQADCQAIAPLLPQGCIAIQAKITELNTYQPPLAFLNTQLGSATGSSSASTDTGSTTGASIGSATSSPSSSAASTPSTFASGTTSSTTTSNTGSAALTFQ